MRQDSNGITGFLFVTHAGAVLHASGAANDPRIIAMATEPDWIAEARRKRLQTISLDSGAFAGLVIPHALPVRGSSSPQATGAGADARLAGAADGAGLARQRAAAAP